jgi:hypothetical protein
MKNSSRKSIIEEKQNLMLIFKSSEKILLQSYRQKVKKQKDFEFY